MRLFVVNVGVNTSDEAKRGLRSPIFPDGTFELVPIKEHNKFARCSGIPRYCDLPSHTGRGDTLATFLPDDVSHYRAHLDPEFGSYTYGDGLSPRAANLKHVKAGDEIWFLARLWDHDGDTWTGGSSFYLVARFEAEANFVILANTEPASVKHWIRRRIRANAHYKRWVLAGEREEFRVIAGHPRRSSRFRRALKVTPLVAGHLFGGVCDPRSGKFRAHGEVLRNRNGKPRRFERFGSITRAIQIFLDSENPDCKRDLTALRRLAQESTRR